MQKLKGMPEGFGVLYGTSKYPTLLYKVQHFLRYEMFLKFLFYHYFLSHLVLKKPFKNECHYDKKLSWSYTIRFTLLVCLCTIQYPTYEGILAVASNGIFKVWSYFFGEHSHFITKLEEQLSV